MFYTTATQKNKLHSLKAIPEWNHLQNDCSNSNETAQLSGYFKLQVC